jgi:hypothetical protein
MMDQSTKQKSSMCPTYDGDCVMILDDSERINELLLKAEEAQKLAYELRGRGAIASSRAFKNIAEGYLEEAIAIASKATKS